MAYFYNNYSGLLATIFIILVAKYIYEENIILGKKQWIIIGASYLIADFILKRVWNGYENVELAIIIPSIVILLSRKRKRIRGMFLVFPAMITSAIPLTITVMLEIIITNKELSVISANIYLNIVSDILAATVLAYIVYYRKKVEELFALNIWDKLIIMCVSVLTITSLFGLEAMQINNTLGAYEKGSSIFILVVLLFLIISTVVAITKNKSTNYYKNLVKLNEHYMKAELRHFKAYKLSQSETRKIRHDMKNHMLCIYEFCKKGKYSMLSEYINNLLEVVENIDTDVHTGNDIVDAIINEKKVVAKENQIKINIDGSFHVINNITPVDTCIIISNAMDNAIEACCKLPDSMTKYINVAIKKDRNYAIITFTNPINKYISIEENLAKTNKEDNLNHGFGLENMKNVIKKYNGELLLCCEEIIQGKAYEFKLEIIILCRAQL